MVIFHQLLHFYNKTHSLTLTRCVYTTTSISLQWVRRSRMLTGPGYSIVYYQCCDWSLMLKKIGLTSHLNRPRNYPPGPHWPGPRNLSIKDGHLLSDLNLKLAIKISDRILLSKVRSQKTNSDSIPTPNLTQIRQ